MSRSIPIVVFVALLASCASAPELATYTIDMTRSGRVDAAVDLDVRGFVVTERLATSRILIQASPTRVESYATDRWASGIGERVELKLVSELESATGAASGLAVSGRVIAFEQVDGAGAPQARVRIEVEIRDAGSNRSEAPLSATTYEATRAAGTDSVEAVVGALSRALEDIAVRIAADALRLERIDLSTTPEIDQR